MSNKELERSGNNPESSHLTPPAPVGDKGLIASNSGMEGRLSFTAQSLRDFGREDLEIKSQKFWID